MNNIAEALEREGQTKTWLEDAKHELGEIPGIRSLFTEFQKYLYKIKVA